MAAAISARPAVPPSKVKRPTPPTIQTSTNGGPLQSSPSPSLSSKRPPPGFMQPPGSAGSNAGSATPTGSAPRLNNRRKDSQKVSESARVRNGKFGIGENGITDKRPVKKIIEPYVKTTSYILWKYRGRLPSFTLHLHPTNFRFDEQDGSFSYNSPMKALLEHINAQTVPHDMIDNLLSAGIKFYENCLIVQIKDHRNTSSTAQTTSNTAEKDRYVPYSIHNYNEHITPSPCVPYPRSSAASAESGAAATSKQSTEVGADGAEKGTQGGEKDPSEESASKGPRTFTTVLFPTPLSIHEEMLKYACMMDPRSSNRKQSQINGRTPASAYPPTPASAGPSTTSGPPAKRMKMMYSSKALAEIESKMVSSTAGALFLDPVDNMEEASTLLHKFQDPLFMKEPPAPKSRKRTVAELAADEALAAEEERFMLIMDERLVPTSTSGGGMNTIGPDGESGGGNFEARFERFKAIEDLKEKLSERKQREAEVKAELQQQELQRQQLQQQQQQLKAKQEQQEHENKARIREQKLREMANAKRQQAQQMRHNQQLQQQRQNQELLQQQQQQPQAQGTPGSGQHAGSPTSSAMVPNGHQIPASQAHHSSPVVRNMTPQNGVSPVVGNGMMNRANHGVSMSVSNSSQGARSPPRPSSAKQQPMPTAAAMVQQRSQQPPSRHGTPSMQNGTPRIQQSTPLMRNVTPTPRMTHASPVNSTISATPVMGHATMATPQMNGQPQMSQQQAAILNQQRQQAFAVQQQRAQMAGSPPNPNIMHHNNLQQLAAHQASQGHHHSQQRSHPQRQNENYHQSMQNLAQQQMAQAGGHHVAIGMPMPSNSLFSNPQQMNFAQGNPQMQDAARLTAIQAFQTLKMKYMQHYGTEPPPHILNSFKTQAQNNARAWVDSQRVQQAQRNQVMMAQMQQGNGMNRMNGMSGVNGMNGMNGLNSMNGMNGMGGM